MPSAYHKLVWSQNATGPWVRPAVDWSGASVALYCTAYNWDLRDASADRRTEIYYVTGTQAQLDVIAGQLGAAITQAQADVFRGPRSLALLQAVIAALDGATLDAKLSRLVSLTGRTVSTAGQGGAGTKVLALVWLLDSPNLNADRLALVKLLWASVKAAVGTADEVLSAGEIARIEALTSYNIPLV